MSETSKGAVRAANALLSAFNKGGINLSASRANLVTIIEHETKAGEMAELLREVSDKYEWAISSYPAEFVSSERATEFATTMAKAERLLKEIES